MMKVLWLAPNFNHYKARFLNHLAIEKDVNLTILSGTGRENMGDQELQVDWSFEHMKVDVSKRDFGKSKVVKKALKSIFSDFDWVLIPAEKKNLLLFIYAMKLRKQNPSVHLFSYNHAKLKSKNGFYGFLDHRLTKFFYNNLDLVVFYTERACQRAIQDKLITLEKAFWANNTVDNTEVAKYYSFQLPPENPQTILFIGRLIPSKRIDTLIQYYTELKKTIPNLQLEIIGDGPEQYVVKDAINVDVNIKWHGTLVDEARIAPIMKRASMIFIPGLSGLSINHAFAYGRPYITLEAGKHGPEFEYISQGINGFVLDGDFDSNIETVKNLLLNRTILELFCDNAKSKGEYLSVQKWVQQIKSSLLHD